ncbi:MAG TPA: hypothetical protein VNA04_12495 [Thermoanaerobaculia bacterium]|nr:hypothetical protein [Thermoanaerobaculia bacterium]
MQRLDAKTALRATLVGSAALSFGLALATALQVSMAPPVTALPLPVVNMSWSLVMLYLVYQDIRAGYLGAVVLGLSVAAFPLIVFFEVLGPAPVRMPAHYAGITSDMVFGIGMVVAAAVALRSGGRRETE